MLSCGHVPHTPVTSWSNCRFISWSFDFTVRAEVTSHPDSDKDIFPSCFPLHQHNLQVMAYRLCWFTHQSICQVMTHIFFFTVYSIGSVSSLANHFFGIGLLSIMSAEFALYKVPAVHNLAQTTILSTYDMRRERHEYQIMSNERYSLAP